MIHRALALWLTLQLLLAMLSGGGNAASAAQMPDDFNFTIHFGIDGKNCIDTYNHTFTKDLIAKGTATIDFVIPADEMREIYRAFVEYQIAGLPYNMNIKPVIGGLYSSYEPAPTYAITCTCDQVTKTVICDDGGPWDAVSGPPDTRDRLVSFIKIVEDYIYSTPDYQNMPPSEGGYD